jgi:hypothetical protein
VEYAKTGGGAKASAAANKKAALKARLAAGLSDSRHRDRARAAMARRRMKAWIAMSGV